LQITYPEILRRGYVLKGIAEYDKKKKHRFSCSDLYFNYAFRVYLVPLFDYLL